MQDLSIASEHNELTFLIDQVPYEPRTAHLWTRLETIEEVSLLKQPVYCECFDYFSSLEPEEAH